MGEYERITKSAQEMDKKRKSQCRLRQYAIVVWYNNTRLAQKSIPRIFASR